MTGHFEPIIPRDLRFEISERMDAFGRTVTPIDEDAVTAVGQKLLSIGVESDRSISYTHMLTQNTSLGLPLC